MGSTALQIHTPSADAPAIHFGQMLDLARELVPTGFLPEHIKTPGQAVAIILQGRELGMEPMRALRSLTMVKGKVVENADSQLARFKDQGGRAVWVTLDETLAVLQLRHPNGDEHTETFSMADADAAGLTKPGRNGEPSMFAKYPRAMLRSRAITAGLKSVGWSGAVGNYDPNEAIEFAPASAGPAIASVARSDAPVPAAPAPAPTTAVIMASDYQVAKIRELAGHTAIDDALAAKLETALTKGITTARADEILVGLEKTIAKATPKPVPAAAEPTVPELQAAADSASIHEQTLRLNALLASDRVAVTTQTKVRERLAAVELTPAVLAAAIAELDAAELPF